MQWLILAGLVAFLIYRQQNISPPAPGDDPGAMIPPELLDQRPVSPTSALPGPNTTARAG